MHEIWGRIRQAAEMEAGTFVDTVLLSGVPHVFGDSRTEYDDVRSELGAKLEIAEADIHMIGSGRLGFSQNPDHLLRLFGRHSDLDFVAISSSLFDETALELVQRAQEIMMVGDDEKRKLKKTRDNLFYGLLRPDQLPVSCSLSQSWFPRLAGPFLHEVTRQYPVKAWLFKSHSHARHFYTAHQARIQPAIQQLLSSGMA
ncbi:MAG TPA: hypothetical protein VES88_11375 [Gemmatimonadaceae bacterium]|nr:hypothetical protein [Gemmatimonadaceae bacterium]